MLDFDKPPAISPEEFITAAETQLTPSDIGQLRAAVDRSPALSGQFFLTAWQTFENELRDEIVSARLAVRSREAQEGSRQDKTVGFSVRPAVAEAIKHADPLEGEKILDRLRWQYLDQKVLGHYFDLEFLIVYILKLKILNRYRMIATGEGRQKFEMFREQLIQEKMSNIHQGEWRE